MNVYQKLKWLLLSGVDEVISENPINRMKLKEVPEAQKVSEPQKEEISNNALAHAQKLVARVQNLKDLYLVRNEFEDCPLKRTAAHTLNGRGSINPQVLCIVDAPDTDDEKNALLMSGEAGLLLDKMLLSIGLNLNQNAYVTSLIPWRPPGNRKPTDLELTLCRPFLEKEIELLKPCLILLFGANVSAELLGISAMSKARGSWHEYQGIPTRVSISPRTLIKMPAQKKLAWEDLQQVKAKLT